MHAIQRQFLVSFMSMGAVLAFLPKLLESRLHDQTQVGLIMSTTGLAVILTPVLMTALADTKLQSRTLIAVLFVISGLACFWQAASHSFVGLLASHTVFAFFFWPLAALQDGLVFADAQQAPLEGREPVPYHRVRLFGTIGFAIPLAGLFFLLGEGQDVGPAIHLGGLLCLLGAFNALTLPRVEIAQARRARFKNADGTNKSGSGPGGRFPTLIAARVLFRGPALVFCVCLFMAHLGNSAYYAFYPIYLTNQTHFAVKWIGPIIMLGVVLELGAMASVGLLSSKLGLKRLLVLGLLFMAARFALLGFWPVQHVAVWTQALHGMTVIAVYVLPPIYLNTLAGDHFRSSIQGLYAMAVFGPARIVGNVLGGALAEQSLPMLFVVSTGTTLLAAIGLAFAFRITNEPAAAADVPALTEGD